MPKLKRIWTIKKLAPIILALVLVLALVFLWHNHSKKKYPTTFVGSTAKVKPPNTVNYSPTPSNSNANASNDSRKANPPSTSTTLDSTPAPNQNLAVTVSRADKDSSGQNFQVAALVSGTTTGTCTITLAQSGQQSISRQEAVTLQTNSYACPVVNIPLSDIPRGSWNVSVTLTSNGQSKTADWAANPVQI